jgi:glycosyltransferase involved in cell wall biosynthesis
VTKPVRILFLNTVGVIGGQEMVLLDLVRGLEPSRYESVVASLLPGALTDVLVAEGRKAVVLPPHRLRRPVELARTLVALARLLAEERIDIVHCNGDSLLFYGALAGALRRLPCVWHVYEPVVTHGVYQRFFYETQRRLRAAWTIFGTAAVEESYLRCYPRLGPHTSIMPGVDSEVVTRGADAERARRRFGLPPGAPILLVIGRLQRSKGQREAIEALAALGPRASEPHLVLCGGPPWGGGADYTDELARRTRAHGRAPRGQ